MSGRVGVGAVLGVALGMVVGMGAAGAPGVSKAQRLSGAVPARAPGCRVGAIEGEVRAGEGFARRIGSGLEVMLEPLASGWIVRVLPDVGARAQHDYAELATPPYQSVSPLLISTDFSFRAQDAAAWNPRRFRFAADSAEFRGLLAAYREYQGALLVDSVGTTGRVQAMAAAEQQLAGLVTKAPQGEFVLLDVHLVPGTADQAGTAAMVASHLNASAHEAEQSVDGRSTPLGKLTWMRFRILLEIPAGLRPDASLSVEEGPCL